MGYSPDMDRRAMVDASIRLAGDFEDSGVRTTLPEGQVVALIPVDNQALAEANFQAARKFTTPLGEQVLFIAASRDEDGHYRNFTPIPQLPQNGEVA